MPVLIEILGEMNRRPPLPPEAFTSVAEGGRGKSPGLDTPDERCRVFLFGRPE